MTTMAPTRTNWKQISTIFLYKI